MSDLVIRSAEPRDAEFLAENNVAMALETEGKRLEGDTVRRGVQAVFENPARGFYLVAELGGRPVGQLMITCEWSDWRNAYYWWVQSVYVLPEARRRGVFRALHAEILRLARRDGNVCGVRLYVDKDNRTAQQTYAALGLRPARYTLFETDFPR